MKYYIIVGEASGDLHASRLMKSLVAEDAEAEFRFFGGDNMAEVGGTMVKHYRELAYMGFIPVLMHLPTILRNMRQCKADIMAWQPDAVILVDYAGFNLSIAKYLRRHKFPGKVFYYIAPKLWAWKEYRIKNIKRDVDELYSILPFEKDFFEKKHGYPINYVGNPTADEVREFLKEPPKQSVEGLGKPTIALLAGSRRQEIKDNLPAMLEATRGLEGYRLVVAGAPGIDRSFYDRFIKGHDVGIVHGETYRLLSESTAALVTSGTATLETCLFRVPQVVCYKTPVPRLCRWGFNHILKVKYISLVNLIADKEVVRELFADRFSIENIRHELLSVLPGGKAREQMLGDYALVHRRLGDTCAPDNTARLMVNSVLAGKKRKNHKKKNTNFAVQSQASGTAANH